MPVRLIFSSKPASDVHFFMPMPLIFSVKAAVRPSTGGRTARHAWTYPRPRAEVWVSKGVQKPVRSRPVLARLH